MKIRLHRGSLEESMKTMEDIDPSIEAIKRYLKSKYFLIQDENMRSIKVLPYITDRPDNRIDWNKTFIILLDGCVIGFCNQEVI